MTLLVADDALRSRTPIANAELAPLADGLLAELAPVMSRELYIPREKALLSREGGRCPRDGTTLAFDPFSPHHHRCPRCGETYTGTFHDRFWIFWYQLWLAERAVHGALLANLRCDERAGSFSASVLDRYADEYVRYPNRDNVLGPTRPFFSTYLESIWLLNLCIALDLLEKWRPEFATLGGRVRDRILDPSSTLIASYDEGASNRQVWNDAALLAAGSLLGRGELGERALFGRSGITYHLANGLLADGTWYEGENYHLFAHRGLWYGVTMAEANGIELPGDLVARFQEGFATPFLSALPDMTLPSRRDSQYAISLRQPRFAELCELGLAREAGEGDHRLRGALRRLYLDDIACRDTGRAQTTADVERNLAGTRLTRADLGWRSLLFARPTLPPLHSATLGTVLLDAQGLAVFRRANERVYVALDYGASGGGHGHPDRLNVLLSDGETRWLDDMGTGSYVDPSLQWYRSTLAHNAPLFNGYQQQRVDGELLGFEEQGDVGWVSARAEGLFPHVVATRTLVVTEHYLFDELAWQDPQSGVMDLPIHVDPASITVRRVPDAMLQFCERTAELDDTLGVLRDQRGYPVRARTIARIAARDGEHSLQGFVVASERAILYRATAPGAPGKGRTAFLLLRVLAGVSTAWVRTVWSWSPEIEKIWLDPRGAFTAVEHRDGSHDRLHRLLDGYEIERIAGERNRTLRLRGLTRIKSAVAGTESKAPPRPFAKLVFDKPIVFDLGRDDYRPSEESWDEAGRPTARLRLVCTPNELALDVTVRKAGVLTFVPADAVNPYDNEHPDINGDGVQVYFADRRGASGCILVPEREDAEEGKVRVRAIDGFRQQLVSATWRAVDGGYALSVRVPLALSPREPIAFGVVINEKPAGRERRRGQLVLGGSRGEFVYLRGDREDIDRLPRFTIVP